MSDTTRIENIPEEPGTVEGTLTAFKTVTESGLANHHLCLNLGAVIADELTTIQLEMATREREKIEREEATEKKNCERTEQIKTLLSKAASTLEYAWKNSSAFHELVFCEWGLNSERNWPDAINYSRLLVLWVGTVSDPPPSPAICLSKRFQFAYGEAAENPAIKLCLPPVVPFGRSNEVREEDFHKLPTTFDEQLKRLADPAELARAIVRALHG